MTDDNIEIDATERLIKVAGSSRPTAVAGAIAGIIRQQPTAKVQAIGATAVNQAVKSIAIAHRYLALEGVQITFTPYFVIIPMNEDEKTAMCFLIEVASGQHKIDLS